METNFQQIRQLLEQAGFTDAALEERFQKGSAGSEPDQLDLLGDLFLRGISVSCRHMHATFTQSQIDSLRDSGLIERVVGDQYQALVSLYPVGPLWIQSDRIWPDRSVPSDVVFSAISPNTQDFLASIPMRPCRSFLELCAGTGTAALLAASNWADRAAAFDLCQRSVEFARTNCLLNGLENVETSQGDMWEPAEGRRFDFIVAHPPYVPSLRPAYVFRDGGTLGDHLLQRIVEGLPEHLEPGGRFYSLALIPEREGKPIEHVVREWLGEASDEFDVFLIIRERVDARTVLFENWSAEHNRVEDIEEWKRLLARHGVARYAYAELIIERRIEPRAVATARRQRSAITDAAALEWMIAMERAAAQPAWRHSVATLRVQAREGIAISVAKEFSGGRWEPRLATLRSEYPFQMEAAAPPWIGQYLEACNGDRTVRSHFLHLQHEGVLSAEASESAFIDLNIRLIAGGFVEAETHQSEEKLWRRNMSAPGDRSTGSSPETRTAAITSAK
jgi:methylase of polypeptide subunit release factors